ncbi:MAG: hypothetical protein ACE5FF_14560, partial [Saprospiraceae bacterium]
MKKLVHHVAAELYTLKTDFFEAMTAQRLNYHPMNFRSLTLVAFLLLPGLLLAQEDVTPAHNVSAKVLFIDYNTPNSTGGTGITNGLELAYLHKIDDNLGFGVPIKIGLANIPGNRDKTTIFSFDLIGRFQFLEPEKRFRPFVFAGGGLVFEEVQ